MPDEKKVAYVFPGQGSQSVGMGKDLYEALDSVKALFKQADDAISFPISGLCFEGPEEELRKTVNAQPALVLVSIACLTVAQELAGKALPHAEFMAGHSLGEYTALAAAGVVDFATAVYLSRERGRLMYDAGLKEPGTMAAVLGLEQAVVEEICRQAGVAIANVNCPGQLAISGSAGNIARASEMAKAKGASRVVPLQVSGAFHSPLMQPAVEGMQTALSKVSFRDPAVPIIANVTAEPLTYGTQIKGELLKQLTSPVQWQRSVEYMLGKGTKAFYEIGPGKVLAGLIRRINRETEIENLGDLASIKALKPAA
jgi:[acyl-carrier-protein] S-malonyltransferase